MRFYLSGSVDNKGNLGVVDREDNIEEFYPREYLKSLDIEIVGINKELGLGYKFIDDCFIYELIKEDNIRGWKLHYRKEVSKFRCKSMEFGYPVISLKGCFYECEGTHIDVSGMDTSNVINMSNMFYDCCNLTSLDITNFDTRKVIDIGGMFSDCNNLISLDISNFDTKNVKYMGGMFSGCTNLTSLDVSNFDTSNVIYMGDMFYKCCSLTSLDISNFDTRKVIDMTRMFYDCNSITSLDITNFDTSNVGYITYMFSGCTNLLILSNSSMLIEQSKKDSVSSLVPSSVYDINFDTIIKVSKNFDLDLLYKKLKMLGLLGGKIVGYKFG